MTDSNFIKNINLPPNLDISSSLVTSSARLTATQRQDVRDSLQLASFAASDRYDRHSQCEFWYGEFSQTLKKLGWRGADFNFTSYVQDHGLLHIDRAALGAMARIAEADQLARLQELLEQFKDPGKLPDRENFESRVLQGNSGNFQLCIARLSGSAVALILGTFYFESRQDPSPKLFDPWRAADMTFKFAVSEMILDENVYGSKRQVVKAKLKNRPPDVNAVNMSFINSPDMRLQVA